MKLVKIVIFTLQSTGAFAYPSIFVRQSGPTAFASSNDQSLKLSQQDAPVSGSGSANGASTWSLSMDDTSSGARQQITGFGAAVTDGTVSNYNKLSGDQKTNLINDMVGSSGANFQLLRHTIASSDMSPNSYSYADNGLNNFNLGDSGNAMAALLKDFRNAASSMTILGSSWSGPSYMKNNDNTFNTQYSDDFAQYFVKYLQAYASAGAPIDAVTIQNEPEHYTNDYDFTMGINADTSADLIQNHIGPAIANANLNTKIWAYDHNTDDTNYPSTVLSKAGAYTNTVAWHCYASGGPDWSVLGDFHNSHNGVEQYMTECWTHSGDSWTTIPDMTFGPLQNWASGVISWPMGTATDGSPYLADGCSECRGLFETDGSSYNLKTDYYMLAQFSKGIPSKSVIHTVKGNYKYGDGTGVDSVASIGPDGSKTLVVQNNFNNPLYLTLNMTSDGSQWSGLLHAESITTWILP